MVKLSVIILNFNQPKLTVDCVNSVLQQDYKDFEIILFDNGSEDDSKAVLTSTFGKTKRLKLVFNRRNDGYAGGNNKAVNHAEGRYIVILNNDTVVENGWLKELILNLEKKELAGSVSSKIIEGYKRSVDPGDKCWVTNLIGYGVLAKRKQWMSNGEIFFPSGCSFIFRKKDVGLPFPSDYFAYAEDIHLGWLLILKGQKNYLAEKSVVNHYHNAVKKSSRQMFDKLTFFGERNRLINLFIFFSPFYILRILPMILFGILFLNIYEPRKIIPRLKSYMWLVFHPHIIIKKRRFVQKQRKVSDEIVIGYLSCKIFEEKRINNPVISFVVKFLNKLLLAYCFIVRLKTVEFLKY